MNKVFDVGEFKSLTLYNRKNNSPATTTETKIIELYQEYFFENKLYGKDTNLILKQLEKQLNVKDKFEENVVLFAYLYHFDREKLNDDKFNYLHTFWEGYKGGDYFKILKNAEESGHEIKF